MAVAAPEGKSYAEVLLEVFDIPAEGMSEELARSILRMKIPESGSARVGMLSEKANDGSLTATESVELEAYVNVANLLALWQSKARQVLSRAG